MTSAHIETKSCKSCGESCVEYRLVPCACPEDVPCLDRELLGVDDALHIAETTSFAVEKETFRCIHGAEYALLCPGCGSEFSSWGIGAAGFGELCDCENQIKDGAP